MGYLRLLHLNVALVRLNSRNIPSGDAIAILCGDPASVRNFISRTNRLATAQRWNIPQVNILIRYFRTGLAGCADR